MLHACTSDAAPERLRKTRVSHTWDFFSFFSPLSLTPSRLAGIENRFLSSDYSTAQSFERAAPRSPELWLYNNSNVFTFFRGKKNTVGVVGGYLPPDGTIVSWRIYFISYLFIFILPFRENILVRDLPSLGPPSGPRRHAVRCDESHRLCILSVKASGCRKRRQFQKTSNPPPPHTCINRSVFLSQARSNNINDDCCRLEPARQTRVCWQPKNNIYIWYCARHNSAIQYYLL